METIVGRDASRTSGGSALSFPFGPERDPPPLASETTSASLALIVYAPVRRPANRYVPSAPVVTIWSVPPESRIWTIAPLSGVSVATSPFQTSPAGGWYTTPWARTAGASVIPRFSVWSSNCSVPDAVPPKPVATTRAAA